MAKKRMPKFRAEVEEQEFWSEHDSSDYVDWSKGRRAVLPNLKPSTKTISLRLPEHMVDELKALANKQDVPYQSLLKMYLAERLEQELRSGKRKASYPRLMSACSGRTRGHTSEQSAGFVACPPLKLGR